ncbi:MAG: cupin domain-containing protein [Myxococcota bacterium]|nr:cupin domain-containing protein [Myxococcota bacterium]
MYIRRTLALVLGLMLPCGLSSAAKHPIVVKKDAAPIHAIGGGTGQAKLFFNATNGSERTALSVLTLSYGMKVPTHHHGDSDELIYVLSGVMEMTVAGTAYTVRAGDAIRIPAGVEHTAAVASKDEPVRAVQIYAVPGPEQRFAKGPLVKADQDKSMP